MALIIASRVTWCGTLLSPPSTVAIVDVSAMNNAVAVCLLDSTRVVYDHRTFGGPLASNSSIAPETFS
ncbi:hypothetical protein PF005_g7685 [Phytophthora fragariae]|uniref:Uncharacterized protein n=1 Tax=Phytophthora fragariae TaxID=53985 RepID=A0A6A3F6N0_9STRA|nr:hypothetical protein PF003_g36388 [Phytophthora fragariae]KAE8941664.1 hypothetical protein PF009_g8543 [Phytophthora fragariae]KAE9005112.1 hypothetical protein PF011_g12176 [Phytophthora fragariae]KAE9108881.1 hypothetical protein PF007_g12473 [Phytophthora fragariae]KAE9139959.1 hypothetical protein PF006_g13635 [Phytophthora fragariae]